MTRRRTKGEGTLYQRPDGMWTAQITLGRDPTTGKQIRKTVYGASQEECLEKLNKLKLEWSQGGPDSDMPLAHFLDLWLTGMKTKVAKTSYRHYARDIRVLQTEVGGLTLQSLKPLQVQLLFQRLEQQGLTVNTRFRAAVRLGQALQQGVQMGMIRSNPTEFISRPRYRPGEMIPLRADQVRVFLEAAKATPHYLLYLVALDTGARIGELLALTWADWFPATRELSFTKQVCQESGEVKELKTRSSRRRVRVSEETARELAARAVAEGPIWSAPRGGALWSQHVKTFGFRPLVRKLGLPPIRFHDLRHTSATLLLMAGVPVHVVSRRLGHANANMTLRTYAHVISTEDRSADVMGAIFNG